MKANGAPEKIYFDGENKACKLPIFSSQNIEYTRTDAFIEKAEMWLSEHWREYINVDADGVVCFGHWKNDFHKAMKGE